jgi:hypothetical protein
MYLSYGMTLQVGNLKEYEFIVCLACRGREG